MRLTLIVQVGRVRAPAPLPVPAGAAKTPRYERCDACGAWPEEPCPFSGKHDSCDPSWTEGRPT